MTTTAQSDGDSAAAGQDRRRFSLRDTLILVAAAAVGLYGYRANDATMTERGFSWADQYVGYAMLLGPGLASLTAGLVALRLFKPRPPRVDLFRQPGFAAGCVALALTMRRFGEGELFAQLVEYDDWYLAIEWTNAIQEVSLGILAAWSSLALAGSLEPERGWLDRSLRAVAMVWVLAGAAMPLIRLFRG